LEALSKSNLVTYGAQILLLALQTILLLMPVDFSVF
jgi:hypothetical protein